MNLLKPIKIVYIEDQSGVRRSVCDYLNNQENISVIFDTADGYALLDFLRTCIPLPDLCILDISMPVMDGITLLKKIRRKWNKLPCLIYSMHYTEHTISKAIYHGANGYLSKKYDYSELQDAIEQISLSGIAYTKDADTQAFENVRNHQVDVFQLTDRERKWIQYAGTEHNYDEIAALMGVTKNTGENYRAKCFKKLKVTTRVGLVMEAIRLGIINI